MDAAEGEDGDVDGAEGEGGGVGGSNRGRGGGSGRGGSGEESPPPLSAANVGAAPPPLVVAAFQLFEGGVREARADALAGGLQPADPAGAARRLRAAEGLVVF